MRTEEMVAEFGFLVPWTINRMGQYVPLIEREDALGEGAVGLLQAINRHDNVRSFVPFAVSRIRGSVLDYLRKMRPASEREQKRNKELYWAERRLEQSFGRPATREDIARNLRISLPELEKRLLGIRQGVELSMIEGILYPKLLSIGLLAPSPERAVEKKEGHERLEEAIKELSNREELVISMYHYLGFSLTHIGEALGLSESMVVSLAISRLAPGRTAIFY